ncbi:hypothetical protein BX659_11087 [Orenia metallireducens]|uniref:Uncharacterized protein n=1 Tax=Orenia metallireducens TaxID=1413210 RepID=A0A285HWD8_9FIRM|nr:hypothetical protein [Orenia metallireducens]PRX29343.1 hypothetical protein BX659_11087 [Orenia metallireducens]SNY40009.1 hypothetical protein SAMN06265827_12631 [Orenia metallireducens]
MNNKERELLKVNHSLLLVNFIHSQNIDIVIISLLALIIIGFFTYGMFLLLAKNYIYSVIQIILSGLAFLLLRQIIKSKQLLYQKVFKVKDKFKRDFPELVDQDIVKLHNKIR